MRFLFFIIVFLGLPTLAAASENPAAAGSGEQEPATPLKEMEGLAELGMNMAMDAVTETGKLYPFSQLVFQTPEGERIKTMGKPRGEKIEPPEEWAVNLLNTIRKFGEDDPKLKAASLVKLHEVKTEAGDSVPGLWVLVDHRNHSPLIVFLPLLKQENGKHKPGKIMYIKTEQSLFSSQPVGDTPD